MSLFDKYSLIAKSALFDGDYYLRENPNVAMANVDPLLHYLEEGARQGRSPHPEFDVALYRRECEAIGQHPENPLLHFLVEGAARGLKYREDTGVRLFVDTPRSQDGQPVEIAGDLNIAGWALSTSGVLKIDVAIDGQRVFTGRLGVWRADVAAAFPTSTDAERSGFTAHIPQRSVGIGEHILGITAHSADGKTVTETIPIVVDAEAQDRMLDERRKVSLAELTLGLRVLDGLGCRPWFVLCLPVERTDEAIGAARLTIESLVRQAYTEWRLVVLSSGGVLSSRMREQLLDSWDDARGQIDILPHPPGEWVATLVQEEGSIAGRPTLLGVIEGGRWLGADMLLECAIAAGMQPNAAPLYRDDVFCCAPVGVIAEAGISLDGLWVSPKALAQCLGAERIVPVSPRANEPPRIVCAGRPLFARDSVTRILAVKLDHIGDCVTALPALRRLKQHFPHATLTVLSGPWARDVWAMEPAIDAVIDFAFYHARSGLGRLTVSDDARAALTRRLGSQGFDLAIDLRKSPDTRDLLQSTGARWLAGFQHGGKFSFLDVELEWDADPPLALKRRPVGDDLLALVEAVALATESDAPLSPPGPAALPAFGGVESRLFAKRVVCFHPAAGTPLRTWPAASFAALADRLIERHDLHIAIVGGADDAAVAETVRGLCRHADAVFLSPETFSLTDLARLLARCDLFVGNNSGPKHLAASLGVPTLGIHSGVVDVREWAPAGPSALAIYRQMRCTPCYLERVEDCGRAIACLTGLAVSDVLDACERLLVLNARGAA